jgi:hypothetical protein
VKTLAALAVLAAGVLAAVPVHANDYVCPPGAKDLSYCQEVSQGPGQTGGAGDSYVEDMRPIKLKPGGKEIDTGQTITCAKERKPPCTGSVVVTAPLNLSAKKAKNVVIGRRGFSILPGKSLKLSVALNKKALTAIRKVKKLRVNVNLTIAGTNFVDDQYFFTNVIRTR